MASHVPERVLQAPPHSLVLVPGDAAVEFFVREDEFALARYPTKCSIDLRLPVWDDDRVICTALLVQLAGRNAGTFDRWINAAEPAGLRVLQLLAAQKTIDVCLVSDRQVRAMRRQNLLAGPAAGLVALLRVRKSWTAEEFDERRRRLDTLYPTSEAMWRAADRMAR